MSTGEPAAPRLSGVRRMSRHRVELTLDDGRVFVFADEALVRSGLAVGMAITASELEKIDREDRRWRAHESALNLLSYRPRSAAELRRRLAQRFDAETADFELGRLQAAGLIDDTRFATMWVEERRARAPRSARLLRQELRAKGVGGDEAVEATAGLDDEEAALAFAITRARRAAGEFEEFAAKAGGALQRRGFSYSVAESAVRRAWAEVHAMG